MELIYTDMVFYNDNEFCNNCEYFKKRYMEVTVYEKYIYKLYVYSFDNIRILLKDKIWEYLNEPFGSCYMVTKEYLESYL